MTETVEPAKTPHMGLMSRLVAVIFSPYSAYAEVARRPRWFGALAITSVLIAGTQFWLLSHEAIQQATLEQNVRLVEGLGITVTDQMYEGMERRMTWSPYETAGTIIVFSPIVSAILAGLLLGIFNAIMGGNGTFRQVFAVVAHAAVISVVGQLISAPINYVREQVSSPMRLNALLPMFDEETAVGMFLGSIDLLIIWWLVSLGIGIGVLYKRRPGPVITGFLAVYFSLVIVVTGIRLAF